MTDPPTRPLPVPGRPKPLPADACHRPGSVIAGRYRLLACHGHRRLLEFWQATDAVTGQPVALTLVDPRNTLPVEFVNEILSLTVRLRGVDADGIAPVQEVLHTGAFGVVVSDWIAGGSVQEVAQTRPSPLGAATSLESLAAAAEAAHRAGLRLGLDDPARVRLRADGRAVLAFPATLPDATVQGDLRGVGGCLYALLADRWIDASCSDWAALEQDSSGAPATLAELRDDVPYLVSATAAGLVQQPPGIASAATLVAMLRQAAADAAAEHSDVRVLAPLAPPPPGGYADFRNFGPAEQRQVARKTVLRGSIATAAAVIAAGVALLGSGLNDFFAEPEQTAALDADQLGLGADRPPAVPPPSGTVKAGATPAPVRPLKAEAFSPDGRPDNPESAGRAIDGDDSTVWPTDTYSDPVPFPNFKSGLGLMLELSKPETIGSVTIDLNSTGTVVQIRSSSTASPSSLDATTALTQPTPLKPGSNTIKVDDAEPTSNVLVWITTLGQVDGESRTDIAEIELHGTS